MSPLLARIRVRELAARTLRLRDQERDREASLAAEEAVALARENLAPADPEFVVAANRVAGTRFQERRFVAALEALEAAAQSADQALGNAPEELAGFYNNRSVLHAELGHLTEAIRDMQRCLAIKEKVAEPVSLLDNLQDLAGQLDRAGRLAEAPPLIRRMADIIGAHLGRDSSEYLASLSNLLVACRAGGDKSQAKAVAAEITAIQGLIGVEPREQQIERARQAYAAGNYALGQQLHRRTLTALPARMLPGIFGGLLKTMLDPLSQYAAELDAAGVQAEEKRDYATALRAYRATVAIFEVAPDDHASNLGKARSNYGLALLRAGRLDEAREWFRMTAKGLGRLLEQPTFTLVRGNVIDLYRALCDRDSPNPDGNLKETLRGMEQKTAVHGPGFARAMKIRFSVAKPLDPADAFRMAMQDRAEFYLSVADDGRARQLHHYIIELYEVLFPAAPARVFSVLDSFIGFAIRRGDVVLTRTLLDRALPLAAELLEAQPVSTISLVRQEAHFRLLIGDRGGAETAFENALDLARKHAPAIVPALESELLTLWMQQGRTGEKIDRLVDREIQRAESALNPRRPEELTWIAERLLYRRRYDEAETMYLQALKLQKENDGVWDPRYAMTTTNLGSLYRLTGQFAKSVPLFAASISARAAEYGECHQLTANSMIRRALALGALGRWEEAWDDALAVARASEVSAQSVATISSREQFLGLLHRQQSALSVVLSVGLPLADRNPEVADALYEAVLRQKGLSADALKARRAQRLRRQYPELHAQLDELNQVSRLVAELSVAKAKAADFDAARQLKAQREAQLAARIPELGLQAVLQKARRGTVQAALPENGLLIEYQRYTPPRFSAVLSQGDEEFNPPRYLAFVLRPGTAVPEVRDLGPASEIEPAVLEFGRLMAAPAAPPGSPGMAGNPVPSAASLDQYVRVGSHLRERLWDPVATAIAPRSHVLIVPDGVLSLLPFDLLPDRTNCPLIDSLLISYLAAGRDLVSSPAADAPAATAPIIFCAPDFSAAGPPPEDTAAPAAPAFLSRLGLDFVPSLAGAMAEGLQVQQILPGSRLITGGDANESALRAVRSPRILHVATHGYCLPPPPTAEDGPDDFMIDAGIILAGANTLLRGATLPEVFEDAVLTAEDAATLDLEHTEMVVLSACRSGVGMTVAGEGVFGLRRGFAAAGAKSVVASLWKVPDRQTAILMGQFYHFLVLGESRANALRLARRFLRQEHPHPFYWGAFICQGEYGPIAVEG